MAALGYNQYFDLDDLVKQISGYLEDFDAKRFKKAFEFAEEAHRGQMRKDGTTPYIVHPVKATEILIDMHADEDILISTLLHDVPEDTDRDIHDVKEHFGDKVAFLVDGITKLSKINYRHNMPARQIESLKKLFLHSAEDPRVILIKLADRLHNMMTLQNIKEDEKRIRIARETLEIYVPIANLFGIQELKSRLEDLCFMNLFPTEYRQLKERIGVLEKNYKKTINEVTGDLKEKFEENDVAAEVLLRKRSAYNIYKKICSQGKTIDELEARIAVRVIVKDIPTCYHVLGITHANFTPKTSRFKDYIANPKVNGYQSLHTTVFGPKGVLVEIQIRTEQMHLESEYGIAAHFFKKDESESSFFVEDSRSSWVGKILEMEKLNKSDAGFLESLKDDVLSERMVIFTPQGDKMDLPAGASVIDFAYSIYDELGHHAVRAEVNGEFKAISAELKSGDVVHIVTSEEASPDLSWLSFAKTNHAKNRIKAFFKKVDEKKKKLSGKKILQKELDIAGLGLVNNINFKKLHKRLNGKYDRSFTSMNQILMAIAEGEMRAIGVVKALRKKEKKSRLFKTGSLIDRFLNRSLKEGPRVNVKIIAGNRPRLVPEISRILYKHSLELTTFKGWTSASLKEGYFSVQVIMQDLDSISRMFDELKQIPGVKTVQRFYYRKYIAFYLVSFLTFAIWVTHPFILEAVASTEFAVANPVIAETFANVALFILLFSVLTLTNLAKNYFPFFRNKMAMWIWLFSVPVIAMTTLFVEIVYFDLKLSWLTLSIEVLLFYVYLGVNYANFLKSKE